jgi:hypothetical protein
MSRLTPLLASLLLAFAPTSQGDELLYVYGPACGACMKWQQDIGPIYAKTHEAKQLPLIKVTLDDWQAGRHPLTHCKIGPVMGTPTFIQVFQCEELDRIVGYSNDELFWLALGRMANRSAAISAALAHD